MAAKINISNAKRFVNTAQTALEKADREYAYYKMVFRIMKKDL